MSGPLAGLRVLELASIGPGPFAAMVLADLGAEVVCIDRVVPAASAVPMAEPLLGRGRRSVAVDLKRRDGSALVLDLVERADVLLEGLRPGVAERLGIGPDECTARNPRLVYGRMTGWGQDGPLALAAGHDINYIALTGALAAVGRRPAPVPPLNLVGDFGGGGMLLVTGVLAALIERSVSGRGQVVDAAMVDGAALLMTMFHEMRNAGLWDCARESNLLDGGAPFYDVYETADGGFLAVGALEPQFYAELVDVLGLDVDPATQHDRSRWPQLRQAIAAAVGARTRDEWETRCAGRDACIAPVLTMEEAPAHPHNRARGAYVPAGAAWVPAPAPRFGRSRPTPPTPAARPGEHSVAVLRDWCVDESRIQELLSAGVVGQRLAEPPA